MNTMSLKQPAPDSPGTPSKRACKVLNLYDKIKVIEGVNGVLSQHAAAVKFGDGRTQINNIILDQQNIQRMYIEGSNADTKYLSHRQLQYPEINNEVLNFFVKPIARTSLLMDPCY